MSTNMGYFAISKCVNRLVIDVFGEAFIRRETTGVWQRRLRLCCCNGTPQNFAGRVRANFKRDALCQDQP